MKICIVGHFDGHPDEGVKNLTFNLCEGLSISHDILKVEIKQIYRYSRLIQKFNPDIIHIIVGPSSILCFFISKILSIYHNVKIVMSAPQPVYFHFKKLIPFLKPNLILVQSPQSEFFFKNMGCNVNYFPNFVDSERFSPISLEHKIELRKKYGLGADKFIVLHVGHIKYLRNLSALKKIQNDNTQVIIVGSTSTNIEEDVLHDLQSSGCIVWTKYFKHIEEIYALSDCYVFPTLDESNCIEVPMSILEAMSCNLPVVCTKFRALPSIFSGGDGLLFLDNQKDISESVNFIRNSCFNIDTRQKILQFSRTNLVVSLENIYAELLTEY